MGEAAKKEDEEKFIPVGPGAEGVGEKAEDEKDEREDKRLAEQENDEEEEKPDVTAEKHKESAKQRRARAKVSRDRERSELNFYRQRNEQLEKELLRRVAGVEERTAQTETAAIDQRVSQIQMQLADADRILVGALKKPNGAGADDFVEAQRIRDTLRDQLAQLNASRQQQERREKARPEEKRDETPRLDRRHVSYAQAWSKDHDWFDVHGTDEDSVVVRAIDEALSGEGYDPTTEEYWDELTARVKRRLPEKFGKASRRGTDSEDEDMDEEERPRAAGPKFSSGGRERPLKKGEVYVSADRKAAMIQAGVWEDPVARNRMLKRYAQMDAQISAERASGVSR